MTDDTLIGIAAKASAALPPPSVQQVAKWALEAIEAGASAPILMNVEGIKDHLRRLAFPAAPHPAQQAGDMAEKWQIAQAPDKCPITRRPFFMALEHPVLGRVPTYGGPYDSYTIPHMDGEATQPFHERELECYRYDHDAGGWLMDVVESVPLRVIHEDVLNDLLDKVEQPDRAAIPAQQAGQPEDAKDAARYRWLRQWGDVQEVVEWVVGRSVETNADFDAAIDAAMSSPTAKKGEGA